MWEVPEKLPSPEAKFQRWGNVSVSKIVTAHKNGNDFGEFLINDLSRAFKECEGSVLVFIAPPPTQSFFFYNLWL